MLSVSTLLIPFLEHNDGIRVNMVASQIRQAIGLVKGEIPLIRTGYEDLYLDYSTYLYRAEDNGKVVFRGNAIFPYLVIRYDNDKLEVINIARQSAEGSFDKTLTSKLHINDEVEKGQVLAHTTHINDDGELILGTNLLTAFITYKGYNFEDAIVVSDKAAEKMAALEYKDGELLVPSTEALLSLEQDIYIPIRKYGSLVKENDILFRTTADKLLSVHDILKPDREYKANATGRFYWTMYSNVLRSKYQKYSQFINEYYKYMAAQEEIIKRNLLQFYTEKQTDEILSRYLMYNKCGQWKYNGEEIDGTLIKYLIVSEQHLKVGSKISNRHGNKGVISRILKSDEYVLDASGNSIDVLLGPLSPIGRMNVGQLFEIHLNRASENFVKKILPRTHNKRKSLLKFISMVDNTYNHRYSEAVEKMINNLSDDEFNVLLNEIYNTGLQIIQPPFESLTYNQLKRVLKYTNTPETETIFLPDGREVQALVGKMYFYRLVHEPEKKILARSVGGYNRKFNQPVGGRRLGGGHRIGEMETWALMAYEAYNFLTEYLNIKSDNNIERIRLLKYLINNTQQFYKPRTYSTVSLEVFFDLLKAMGIEINIDNSHEST